MQDRARCDSVHPPAAAGGAPHDRPRSLAGEYARLLCLATAPLGGCAWALTAWRFPWSLVMVAVSIWITARCAGVETRPLLTAVLTLAGLAAVLAVYRATASVGEDAAGVFPPFSPTAYLGMLALVLTRDLSACCLPARPPAFADGGRDSSSLPFTAAPGPCTERTTCLARNAGTGRGD